MEGSFGSMDMRQGVTQANREQQEDDAELCDETQLVTLDHRTRRIRAEHDTHQQVTERRGDAQPLEHRDDQYRGQKQYQELYDRLLNHDPLPTLPALE